MRTIVIDGRRCKTREQVHEYLSKKPFAPPYCGKNLDALYDALTSCGERVCLRVRYAASIEAHLGDYGRALLRVFRDAAGANENLVVELL